MSEKQEVQGWFPYKGVVTMQVSSVKEAFTDFFSEVQPKQVLEIGTASGGTTLLARDVLDDLGLNDVPIRTYDVLEHNRIIFNEAIESGVNIDFRLENIFNDQFDDLRDPPEEVLEFVHRSGTTLVLCDGGNKVLEFNIMAKYVQPGDILMAHDYSQDAEYFEAHIKDKIWNWLEISDANIADACDQYNLQPIRQQELQKVVWVARQKKEG